MADDSYSPVQPFDPEEEKRRAAPFSPGDYPIVSPPPQQTQLQEPTYAPVTTQNPAVTMPTSRTVAGIRPTPADYPAPAMPNWKRALGALATGAAAFQSPAAGEAVSNEVFERPKQEATQKYQQAEQAYNTQQEQELARTKEAREEEALKQKPELIGLQAEKKGELQGRQLEAQEQRTREQQEGANKRAEEGDQVKKDVAGIMVGGKPIETRDILVNGKAHTMGLNPITKHFDIDMGETGFRPEAAGAAAKETDRAADIKSQYGVVQQNINSMAKPDVVRSFDVPGVAAALYNATAQTVTHAGAFVPGVGAFAIPSGTLDNLVTRGIISAAQAQNTVDAYNQAVEGAMQYLMITQGGRIGRGGAALLQPLYNLIPGPRTTNSKQALDQLNRWQDMFDVWKRNHKEYGDAAGPSFRDKPKASKEDLVNKYAPGR
jgi:hypothetical protein